MHRIVEAARRAGVQVDELSSSASGKAMARGGRLPRRQAQTRMISEQDIWRGAVQRHLEGPGCVRLPPTLHSSQDGGDPRLASFLFERDTGQPTAVIISAIAGQAGVGKTALAVRLAHEVKPRFPDGCLYLNLRRTDAQPLDPAIALANVLLAIGAARPQMPENLEERAALYREWLAAHRVLVVLDNAVDEAQVRPFCPRPTCAACHQPVAVGGLDSARILNLDVLEPHQAVQLLARVSTSRLDDAELEDAHEVVRLCGYLPLASGSWARLRAGRTGSADCTNRLAMRTVALTSYGWETARSGPACPSATRRGATRSNGCFACSDC